MSKISTHTGNIKFLAQLLFCEIKIHNNRMIYFFDLNIAARVQKTIAECIECRYYKVFVMVKNRTTKAEEILNTTYEQWVIKCVPEQVLA